MLLLHDLNSRVQIKRFLIVGGLSVLIDFMVYRFLLWVLTWVSFSKISGFICASIFAYFVNKNWTFHSNRDGVKTIVMFIIVYVSNLALNTGTNSLLLLFLGNSESSVWISFLFASGVSASMNFLGMKFIVFREKVFQKKR